MVDRCFLKIFNRSKPKLLPGLSLSSCLQQEGYHVRAQAFERRSYAQDQNPQVIYPRSVQMC
uniref:Uncharacterized protein n=1 Tax=Physcomitrium patens TaxID=3218 RepID=A0A7I4CIS7_PHYPA